jgi:hypothetical protein
MPWPHEVNEKFAHVHGDVAAAQYKKVGNVALAPLRGLAQISAPPHFLQLPD